MDSYRANAIRRHNDDTPPNPVLASEYFFRLINSVEVNDITMLEFLESFEYQLQLTKNDFPMVIWVALKKIINSLQLIFYGATQPCDAIRVEEKNADQICGCLSLMRDILHCIAFKSEGKQY